MRWFNWILVSFFNRERWWHEVMWYTTWIFRIIFQWRKGDMAWADFLEFLELFISWERWRGIRRCCHLKCYSNVSLKMLSWRVTQKATLTSDRKGYRDGWRVTENGTLMCHWKVYYVGCQITEKATMTCHWKCYGDKWWVTEKATLTCDLNSTLTCHWKSYGDEWWVTEKAIPICY
jgi:hypothetical protein